MTKWSKCACGNNVFRVGVFEAQVNAYCTNCGRTITILNMEEAIQTASKYCMGCAAGQTWVWPPQSSVVGQAAVHQSGIICVPNTIRMLLKERKT